MNTEPKVTIFGERDGALVDSAGTPVATTIHGVTYYDVPTHCDERGSVTELFDKRWNWPC